MKNIHLISLILISTFILTKSSYSNQNPSDSSSQKSSLQIEQERIEKELKRLEQPEVKREREMLDDLNRAMEKYYKSKDETSRQKYESLYKQALTLPNPSAKVYSACATAANLLDQPKQAINLLKKAISEYPEERVWGPVIPLKVSGHYRIGSIAMRIGDANEAARAYENVIKNSQDFESSKFNNILSLMFLTDISARLLNDKQLALKRIQEMKEIIESTNADTLQHEENNTLKFLRGWTMYEQERIETGEILLLKKTDLSKEEYTLPYMLSMTHATLSQPSIPEMEQNAQSDISSLDSILNKFALAFTYMHETDYRQQLSDNLPKAEKFLSDIAQIDSYFKPYAEVILDLLCEQKKKYKGN